MPSGVSSFLLDCLDVDSPASNMDFTLLSVEEFRKADNYDEGTTLVCEDGMMKSVKNSTLLDLSHAQDLEMQQSPNISSILELSPDTSEDIKKSFSLSPISISPLCGPSETLASNITSGCELKPVVEVTPLNRIVVFSPLVRKKCFAEKENPIKCRKVTFSDIVSIRNVSSHKLTNRPKMVQQNYIVQQDKLVKPREDTTSKVKNMTIESPGTAKFFDFADKCEKDAFFKRLTQTYSFQFPAKPGPEE